MKLVNYFKSLFTKSPKTPYKQCERVIRKLGYKKEDEGAFISESSSGTTMIWLSENGVKIKAFKVEKSYPSVNVTKDISEVLQVIELDLEQKEVLKLITDETI